MTGKMGLLPSAHTHPCSGSRESQDCTPHGLGKRAGGALPFWITGLTWTLGPLFKAGTHWLGRRKKMRWRKTLRLAERGSKRVHIRDRDRGGKQGKGRPRD